jgi:hypothetical protein
MGFGFPVIGIPHFAVGVDVAGGGLGIEFPIMAAEGLEEGETLWNAGVVQKVIECVFDQTGISAAAVENFPDGGCVGLDHLLVERLERSESRREILKQILIGFGIGQSVLLWPVLGIHSGTSLLS